MTTASPTRTEADLQADVSVVLLGGGLNLADADVVRREVPVGDGTRRRIDVAVGHLIIETKKNLRIGNVRHDAEQQLHGYVKTLTEQHAQRYAAVLTDGRLWCLYSLGETQLDLVYELDLTPSEDAADRLISWLDAVLATRTAVTPTAAEIVERLGAGSPSHELLYSSLSQLYHSVAARDDVKRKRTLWAKLLRTAFGDAFSDDEALFVNHTMLVLTAEAIAHALLGFDLRDPGISVQDVARGALFADAQVYGVVEADFFDWVLDVDGGTGFVRDLVHRVAQFDWSRVEHDVLKVLYESVIDTSVREDLGEYYTPDWLAERMVAQAVESPLTQRVLDPACGSGTFLFHAVRAYLKEAESAGKTAAEAVSGVTRHVMGIDVHPVAATFARVTYLLALGSDRLRDPGRGPLTVPVYLGDAIQWEQHDDLLTEGIVRIPTSGEDLTGEGEQGLLYSDDLLFPNSLLDDAGAFDRLVSRMADAAVNARPSDKNGPLVEPILSSMGILDVDRPVLRETFGTLRHLGDTIWAYYARNLVRPMWLAQEEHRVDVIVGNPPWLRYSKMTHAMQRRYKALAEPRGLLSRGRGQSGRDLSTLFAVRAVELYLKKGGRLAFVMPHGVMSRQPHAGFRTGDWISKSSAATATFEPSWDLAAVTTGFPMTSCVIWLRRNDPKELPATVEKWSGRLSRADIAWTEAARSITVGSGTIRALDGSDTVSDYHAKFRQGAILVPRVLLRVSTQSASQNPLGFGAGRVHVSSFRSAQEKKPWKFLDSIQGTIERRFVHPMMLGETVLPFRLAEPAEVVLPIREDRIMSTDEVAEPEGLSTWWVQVEQLWKENRVKAESAPLLERMDFHGQLSAQLPTAAHRVVYTKAGATLFCARVEDPRAVIDHKLYWAPVSGLAEARYLTAVLNSHVVLDRVRPLQSQGLFGPRDFDKYVFYARVPLFNRESPRHLELVRLAAHAEQVAATVDLGSSGARRRIEAALVADGVRASIEETVRALIPEAA